MSISMIVAVKPTLLNSSALPGRHFFEEFFLFPSIANLVRYFDIAFRVRPAPAQRDNVVKVDLREGERDGESIS